MSEHDELVTHYRAQGYGEYESELHAIYAEHGFEPYPELPKAAVAVLEEEEPSETEEETENE